MANAIRGIFVLLVAMTALTCSSVISKDIRDKANTSLSFAEVLNNPNAFKGQTVIWGGEIINVENQNNEATFIEVYQRPLGSDYAPDLERQSNGRFIVHSDAFLDPYKYKTGKKITAGGKILGEEVRPIGKMNYTYPVILAEQVYLWEESYFYAPPPNYFYDPWRGYPYYGPYWGPLGFGDEDWNNDYGRW